MRAGNAQRSCASVDVVDLPVCLPDHGAPRGPDLAAGPQDHRQPPGAGIAPGRPSPSSRRPSSPTRRRNGSSAPACRSCARGAAQRQRRGHPDRRRRARPRPRRRALHDLPDHSGPAGLTTSANADDRSPCDSQLLRQQLCHDFRSGRGKARRVRFAVRQSMGATVIVDTSLNQGIPP